MQYITNKKNEMSSLLRLLVSGENLLEYNNIIYTVNEIEMMIGRVQRQIDGYKRVHANLKNKSMTVKEFALFKALAIKEHEYFLEVENKIDSYTVTKLLKNMSPEKYENTFKVIKNLNIKMAERSKVSSKKLWIDDRTFELSSIGDIQDFEIINESLYNINCLDCLMSGKISKEELEKANLWRVIHENHTNSIYVEVGNILRNGESALTIP